MIETSEGTPLWEPSDSLKENANLTRYARWLERERGLSFSGYADLWE